MQFLKIYSILHPEILKNRLTVNTNKYKLYVNLKPLYK